MSATLKPGKAPKHDAPIRVVVYYRVSEDRSGHLRSITDQRAYIAKQAKLHGWIIVAEFDEGEAPTGDEASSAARTEFFALLARISQGDVDMLVSLVSSRAGRAKPERDQLAALLQSTNTLWWYDGTVVDLNDPTDECNNSVQQAYDIKFSKDLRKRVSIAHAEQAEAGAAHGRIPFGYIRVRDEDGFARNLPDGDPDDPLDEGTARIVRVAAERYLAGDSLRTITAWLNTVAPLPKRAPTKKRPNGTAGGWDRAGVRTMLISPTYCGWRKHKPKGSTVATIVVDETGEPKQAWLPIITPAMHRDIVDRFDFAARNTPNRGNDRRHLLSGVALCGVCGMTLDARRIGAVKGGAGYATYTCGSKKGHVVISEDATDRIVIAGMLEGIKTPYRNTSPSREVHVRIDNEIAKHEAKIAEWEEAIATDDDADGVSLSKAIKVRRGKIAELEASRPTRNVRPTTLDAVAKAADPYAEFESYTIEQRAAMIRSEIRVTIMPTTAPNGVFDDRRIVVDWLDDDGAVIAA